MMEICFPARPIFHFRLFFSLLVGSRRISYQRSQPQTGQVEKNGASVKGEDTIFPFLADLKVDPIWVS
ncbi:hypothetical protein AAC387_Pa04g0680 [Persea americana]